MPIPIDYNDPEAADSLQRYKVPGSRIWLGDCWATQRTYARNLALRYIAELGIQPTHRVRIVGAGYGYSVEALRNFGVGDAAGVDTSQRIRDTFDQDESVDLDRWLGSQYSGSLTPEERAAAKALFMRPGARGAAPVVQEDGSSRQSRQRIVGAGGSRSSGTVDFAISEAVLESLDPSEAQALSANMHAYADTVVHVLSVRDFNKPLETPEEVHPDSGWLGVRFGQDSRLNWMTLAQWQALLPDDIFLVLNPGAATVPQIAGGALPDTISGLTMASHNYHHGPFIDGNDNLYLILNDFNAFPAASEMEAWKEAAADVGSGAWAQVDLFGGPFLTGGNDWITVWVAQDGASLYVGYRGEGSGAYAFAQFDMSDHATPDNWSVADETISTADPGADADASIAIERRGAGDPTVALYNGATDSVMGTAYERVDYARRSAGGTWTADIRVFGDAMSDQFDVLGASIVRGTSNGLHFLAHQSPGLVAGQLQARTLNSSDGLSTLVTSNSATNVHSLMSRGVGFDDAGTFRIKVLAHDSINDFDAFHFVEDGSANIAVDGTDAFSHVNDGSTQRIHIANRHHHGNLAVDGTTTHAVWANSADNDIYHDKANAPAHDADWGTDVEEFDAVTAARLSANVLTKSGGGKMIGVIYSDGTHTYYNEIAISAAPPNVNITPVFTGGGKMVEVLAGGHALSPVFTGGGKMAEVLAGAHATVPGFTGGGSLAPLLSTGRSIIAAASGGGAMASVTGKGAGIAPAFSGGGTLVPLLSGGHAIVASVSGGGALVVIPLGAHVNTAAFSAGGSLVSLVTGDHVVLPAITGGGSLVAAVAQLEAHSITAAFTGGGKMVEVLSGGHVVTPLISGGGALASVVTGGHLTTLVASGGGSAVPVVLGARQPVATFSGGGKVVFVLTGAHFTSPVASGGGSLAAVVTGEGGDAEVFPIPGIPSHPVIPEHRG